MPIKEVWRDQCQKLLRILQEEILVIDVDFVLSFSTIRKYVFHPIGIDFSLPTDPLSVAFQLLVPGLASVRDIGMRVFAMAECIGQGKRLL